MRPPSFLAKSKNYGKISKKTENSVDTLMNIIHLIDDVVQSIQRKFEQSDVKGILLNCSQLQTHEYPQKLAQFNLQKDHQQINEREYAARYPRKSAAKNRQKYSEKFLQTSSPRYSPKYTKQKSQLLQKLQSIQPPHSISKRGFWEGVKSSEFKESIEQKSSSTEGRYIKGDPLKGYYDFVLTEGSYKFWAAFQLGTAILIIYSTFAAIYYTKINPLVADYDYHDYLGGNPSARSLSSDDDFPDDNDIDDDKETTSSQRSWLPRMTHSLKFILDSIDRIPTDH